MYNILVFRFNFLFTPSHIYVLVFHKFLCLSCSVNQSVFVFQEEEMPEVEIDIDDLLEVNSDDERASKLQVCSLDCICKSSENTL